MLYTWYKSGIDVGLFVSTLFSILFLAHLFYILFIIYYIYRGFWLAFHNQFEISCVYNIIKLFILVLIKVQ